MACSHTESLAIGFSNAVRGTIEGNAYQSLWSHNLSKSLATHWQLEGKENLRSSYIAAGVGGGITGEGADLLIIDDPIKNYEEADSKTYRDKTWLWWTTTALTRLQPGGAVIIIMTRWHEDDLAGRIIKSTKVPKADQWEILHLKAIENGKALWPERYPLEDLERRRAGQVDDPNEPGAGSRAFEALYQGNPTLAGGNIFRRDWWRFYTERPEINSIIHSWDTAYKGGAESDYSVCQVWGKADNAYYLLDLWRQRVEYPELKRAAIALYERDHPTAVYIEDKASGQSLVQELKRDTAIPIKPVKVDKDKVARANAVTPLIESGRVYLPERASWLHNLIEELSSFPSGEHDDQVDALTQALSQLASTSNYFDFRW